MELAKRARANVDQHGHQMEQALEDQIQACIQNAQETRQSSSSTMTFSSAAKSDASMQRCLENYETLQGHSKLVHEKRGKELACPAPLQDTNYMAVRGRSLIADDGTSPSGPLSETLNE